MKYFLKLFFLWKAVTEYSQDLEFYHNLISIIHTGTLCI